MMIAIDHSNNTVHSEDQNGRYLFQQQHWHLCSKCLKNNDYFQLQLQLSYQLYNIYLELEHASLLQLPNKC
jgi:hypothetical protein